MRSLRISKLVLEGEKYKRSLIIDKSLIIIKGDGFSGKSLFLKLIEYCLGSKSESINLTVQAKLEEYCDIVFLEIFINKKIYTLSRQLKNNKNNIDVYLSSYEEHKEYSPWKKKLDELLDFLVDELSINFHSILRKKSGSKDLAPEKISFRDLMRYIYIEQNELGTNQFLENNNPFISGKNKEVFKIINDLIIPDIEEIEKEIQIKQNECNRLEGLNNGLNDYLNNRDSIIIGELYNDRDKLDKKIGELKSQKKAILENNKSEKTDLHYRLMEDINNINVKIMQIEKEKSNVILSIKNKKNLLEEYNDENVKLEATVEAMKKIKIVDHKEKCPLCNSFVSVLQDKEEQCEDIENVLEKLKNKIETLKILSENEERKINQFDSELSAVHEKKQVYLHALDTYKKNIEVPFLSEIESINSIIRDLTTEKNKINSLVDIHNELNNNLVNLNRLQDELGKLKSKKNDLKKLTVRQELILNRLNYKYRMLMKQFNFTDINEERCYIDKENYLPYYSGASVMKHSSGCLLLCMQIAYLGAILELNQEEDNNCHPGLLMLDTLSNNIGTDKADKESIDPKTYQEIYNYLIKLAENNQIFIIDNTPPKINSEHIELIFHRVNPGEKLKGLIDIDKNEKILQE